MDIYRPYTYLIGWSHLNKYYYGVRFAKNCRPEDLWVKYFTSSKKVKELRKIEGEPDIIEVRKIFTEGSKAIIWEEKVLKRLDVLNNDKWLNMNISGAIAPHKAGLKNKGRKRSKESINKAIETRKKNNKPSPLKGRKNPSISKALKGKPSPHKGKKYGPISEITKEKMSESRKKYYENGGKAPNNNKKMSENQKAKISKSSKGHKNPKSHSEKLRAIALRRFKISLEDGSWTWGYRDLKDN